MVSFFCFLFWRARQAYSEADHRVKELAYVVKHWAKRRWVNNASEGTLSSYGYLLCLVHYLQTRSPPVVPNLQVRSRQNTHFRCYCCC